MDFSSFKNRLKDYFNLTSYLEDEKVAVESIMEGVSFRGPNIVILILAIIIASLGLNMNSAPVVIGAMLVSPLMGPILGIGYSIGTYNFPLLKRSLRNIIVAAAFSILASTIYFLISPVNEGHSELLARTSPTIYDVLVGFFGGGAGIVAVTCKQKGNVLPGVAIATALLPPLCTVGYGIATWQLHYSWGAFYLFFINCIFIALSTLVGVKLFHYSKYKFVDVNHRRKVKRWLYAIVLVTFIPSIFLTIQMFQESYFVNDANSFIDAELTFPNTQVFSRDIYMKHREKFIDVTLIGQQVDVDSLERSLTAKMNYIRILRGTHLKITQGFSTNALATTKEMDLNDVFSTAMNQIERQKAVIDSLNHKIQLRENLDSISYTIAPEIKVLYPEISYIALNRTLICDVDTRKIDTVNVALVERTAPIKDLTTVRRYIETRTGLSDLHIIETRIPIASEAHAKNK